MKRIIIVFIISSFISNLAIAKNINITRANWDTGWFQAEVYKVILERLGYNVKISKPQKPAKAYKDLANGKYDLFFNGWFPTHSSYLNSTSGNAVRVSNVIKKGGLQGIIIDKKTAERFNIESITDLRNHASQFDINGDGRADLIGCPKGWGCEKQISNIVNDLDLNSYINVVKNDYFKEINKTINRFNQGKSVLFYTWSPNYPLGAMKLGKDILWIDVPYRATSKLRISNATKSEINLGFNGDDISVVANTNFIRNNPEVENLLKNISFSINDVSNQNLKMHYGEKSDSNIRRHAENWVASNSKKVTSWIEGKVIVEKPEKLKPEKTEQKPKEVAKKPQPSKIEKQVSKSSDIDSSLITIGSGSGFYINNKGYALTNNHVIDICKQSIAVIDGKETLFRVIATDKTNDVAVLKTDYKSRNFIKINEDGAKLGENVIAVGYPLAGRLSDSVKITRGIVSSLSGLDNNIGQIQIDAALQPGNSGGPVLNENGELVGIASAGLNKLLMAKEAKYIPENVNFAVASPIVVNILKSKKVKYTTPGMFGGSFSNTELAELGDSSTIQLFCRNTRAEYARLKKSKQYSQVLLDID